MKLTFLGANRNVTGSRYCLEAAGCKIVIDCGLTQERAYLSRNWEPSPIPVDQIKALVVTHAHIDHIGLIPRLVAQGFRGRIFATQPTVDLADVMLKDSAKIQMEDAKYKKRRHEREGRKGPYPEVPLYTDRDAEEAMRWFRGIQYDQTITLAPGVTATWHDAGHILGSASIEIRVEENGRHRTIVFSGDIGQRNKPLICNPTFFRRADYVVMESTYGDRDHDRHHPIDDQLESVTRRTLAAGGNLVIPVFAIERAQEMMYHFGKLIRQQRIPQVPIFLDSPLAYDATNIFRKYSDWLDDETRRAILADEPPLRFPGLKLVRTPEESKAINQIESPCIIMAPAGMCNAGRIKHHLKANIERPESTILFVGYQAEGTLGRQILSGQTEVRIHGRYYHVEANVEQIFGLSAHADRTELMEWISHFEQPPKQLFLTHGEESASLALQHSIQQHLGWNSSIPEYGQEIEFTDTGPSLVAPHTSIVDKQPKQHRSEESPTVAPQSTTTQPSPSAKTSTAPTPIGSKSGSLTSGDREHADYEFLDAARRRPISFLFEDPWRVMRIQSDMIQGIETVARALDGRRRAISVFGSARLPEIDDAYQQARQTCRILGQHGFAVITGGGPGIMEAANRGAREAATLSIGLNIDLPHEQRLNPFCDVSYKCRYFFVRKMLFAKYSRGFIIFPGGFGTLDELFESLTLIQTAKLAEFPVVLVDSDYWGPMVDWLRNVMLPKGCISDIDLDRFRLMDDPEEIAATLNAEIT